MPDVPDERRSTPTRPPRADIQALRAVAVVAVLLFHLWPDQVPGGYVGVDVFFVISGFLITSHIARDVDAGRFSVAEFWSRRTLRLLPASTLVLGATAVGVWALVPVQHREQWFREIAASVLSVQNWVLADAAVDYLAARDLASPVRHYWSLSAEAQLYLIWPLLIAGCLVVSRWLRSGPPYTGHARHGAGWRAVAAGALALVVVASLVTSVLWTDADQAYAYFVTPTRAWEFGAGALLAFAPSLSPPPSSGFPVSPLPVTSAAPVAPAARAAQEQSSESPARSAVLPGFATWAGLALIGVAAVVLTDATPFPGAWATLPVLGTVLVIGARVTDRSPGSLTSRLAASSPVRFLGDVSYAVYLWHWPVVVLVPYATGHALRTGDKLAVLLATLLLAWATRRWVELPVLRHRDSSRPWGTFAAAAAVGTVVVAVALTGVHSAQKYVRSELAAAEAAADDAAAARCFGAAARPPGGEPCADDDPAGTDVPTTGPANMPTTDPTNTPTDTPTDTPTNLAALAPAPVPVPVPVTVPVPVPAPEAAAEDMPAPYALGADMCSTTDREEAEPVACERGRRGSSVRVALVGDSHAAHYASALVGAAEANDWALDIYVKAGCPFSDAMRVQDDVLTATCAEWVDRTERLLVDGDYDLVVTSQMSGVDWAAPTSWAGDQETWAEAGLAGLWARLADDGTPVAAVA
ncbi:acyltransferase family protein, partial [Promicromonospora kroppenstedtii]|uniref:acyltransferase family protein n=1 Tax=Promicromonospora kroppenstedtii TaxID=440482 RepID=UPI0006853251